MTDENAPTYAIIETYFKRFPVKRLMKVGMEKEFHSSVATRPFVYLSLTNC